MKLCGYYGELGEGSLGELKNSEVKLRWVDLVNFKTENARKKILKRKFHKEFQEEILFPHLQRWEVSQISTLWKLSNKCQSW